MTNRTQKYQDIFKAGKELYWKYGIKRVTIEEICKKAKVSKVTFYKFFSNKIELAKEIINDLFGRSIEEFETVLNGNSSFTTKIEEIFRLKIEATKNMSVEFAMDIYKIPDKELQELLEIQRQRSMAIFIDFLKDSQAKGLIRKDIKIDFVLFYMNQMMEMLQNKELLAKYNDSEELALESLNFMFYGLLNQKAS